MQASTVGELTEKVDRLAGMMAAQRANIDRLVDVTNQDAEAIGRMAYIVGAHEARHDDTEERLDRLEGDERGQ